MPNFDERTYQRLFYERLKNAGFNDEVLIERSTDGFTKYILFEHKPNINVNGKTKTIGQAIKYLVRMNKDGMPVPGTIVLISQEEEKAYIYSSSMFANMINDIQRFITGRASGSVDSFEIPERYKDNEKEISYHIDITDSENDDMKALVKELKSKRSNVRVNITIDNVVGWARYYYDNCKANVKTKEKMFSELRNPIAVLGSLINPWTGENEEFSAVMDQLNDMALQKVTGAYYTPQPYCEIATNMLIKRVSEFKEKYPDDDYIIIDRCAGTGNMELSLEDVYDNNNESLLSHCIVNTLEYQEWIALHNRFANIVRVIIPNVDIPTKNDQLIEGSDATSEEFNINLKKIISEVKKTEHCGIFFYENPPYVQTGTRNVQGASFKDSYISKVMRYNGYGNFTNDLFNQFVWSGFDLMENEEDCYVLIGPLKPWKNNGFIDKEVVEAYLTNRKHYHTSGATANPIVCYRNKHSDSDSINFTAAIDIVNGSPIVVAEDIIVRKSYNNLSKTMYDRRKIERTNDNDNGILVSVQGNENLSGTTVRRVKPISSEHVVGYMDSHSFELENGGQITKLLVAAVYDGNGCYLWDDDWITRIPAFSAGFYKCITNKWYDSIYSKSGDGAERYFADIKEGKLNNWLIKNMIWVCMTRNAKMYSLNGSDGRKYINQLCFGQNTLADEILSKAFEHDFEYNDKERELFNCWNRILTAVKETEEYTEHEEDGFTYGTHMIVQEICKEYTTINSDGEEVKLRKNNEIYENIKDFEKKLDTYYISNIAPTLKEYEFIK